MLLLKIRLLFLKCVINLFKCISWQCNIKYTRFSDSSSAYQDWVTLLKHYLRCWKHFWSFIIWIWKIHETPIKCFILYLMHWETLLNNIGYKGYRDTDKKLRSQVCKPLIKQRVQRFWKHWCNSNKNKLTLR